MHLRISNPRAYHSNNNSAALSIHPLSRTELNKSRNGNSVDHIPVNHRLRLRFVINTKVLVRYFRIRVVFLKHAGKQLCAPSIPLLLDYPSSFRRRVSVISQTSRSISPWRSM